MQHDFRVCGLATKIIANFSIIRVSSSDCSDGGVRKGFLLSLHHHPLTNDYGSLASFLLSMEAIRRRVLEDAEADAPKRKRRPYSFGFAPRLPRAVADDHLGAKSGKYEVSVRVDGKPLKLYGITKNGLTASAFIPSTEEKVRDCP